MVVGGWKLFAVATALGISLACGAPSGPVAAQTEGEMAPGGRPGASGWSPGWRRPPDRQEWRDYRQQQWEAQQWRQHQQWQRQQWETQQWRQYPQPQYYGGPVDQWGRPVRPPPPGWYVDPYTGRRERILN